MRTVTKAVDFMALFLLGANRGGQLPGSVPILGCESVDATKVLRVAEVPSEMLDGHVKIAVPAKQHDMNGAAMASLWAFRGLGLAEPDQPALPAMEVATLFGGFLQMVRCERVQLRLRHKTPFMVYRN